MKKEEKKEENRRKARTELIYTHRERCGLRNNEVRDILVVIIPLVCTE
jgi:hypothetical protein